MPFLPFKEALDFARSKQLLPTTLTSAEISRLSEEVKRRSVFSARVDDAGELQLLQDLLTPAAGGLVDEHGRLVSIPEMKAQIREYLKGTGYLPSDDDEGTIKDLLSNPRRQLQVETNLLDTLGYGRWQRGQDPVELDVNPGWELVRMVWPRGLPRDWPARWQDAGGVPVEGNRMVALKDDPVWQALGDGAGGYEDTLGNPWPPFAFNSGMNVIDVSREDCIALGLMGPDDEVEAQDVGLNDHLEASVDRFDAALRSTLEQFPGLEIRDGVLRLKNSVLRNRARNVLRTFGLPS